MRFYGIEMMGRFTLQKVNALPTPFTEDRDRGRLLYNRNDHSLYLGEEDDWHMISGLEAFDTLPVHDEDDSGRIIYIRNEEKLYYGKIGAWEEIGGPTSFDLRYVNLDGDDMTGNLNVDGNISATGDITANKVWNAVYNDLVDYQKLAENEKIKSGYTYYSTENGLKICYTRCQLGVMGIASDVFGMALGSKINAVPISISGWVLAYVDDYYPIGTPLTNDENGMLTKMTIEEKQNYPERLLAIMDKKEFLEYWPENKEIVKVDGRYWVKVK